MMILRYIVTTLSVAAALGASCGHGQDYPNKPIRFLTSPVGGGSDITSRLVGQGLSGSLGQPIVVDNRASGGVAAEAVAKSPPDGYALLVGGNSVWIEPLLRKVPYDPINDFSPVTITEMSVNLVTVHPSVPAKSIKELIALAKARPGELNYGSGTTGASSHMAVALFTSMAGINIVRVPYKSMGPATADLISGQIQLTMGSAGTVLPHIKSGRIRALAVTSAGRSALFPDLAPVADSVPGYESVALTAIFAPAKTPASIVNRLNQEVVRFLKTAEAKEKLFNLGAEPLGMSPEEVAVVRKSETTSLSKLIKEAGIRAD